MNALIKTKDGFYCSTVFAYYRGNDWGQSKMVVFNQSNSQLVMVKCNYVDANHHIRLNVLFTDGDKDNWVKCGEWEGIDFIVNDKDLLNNIEKGGSIPFEVLDKCKALQTAKTFCGWNAIDTDDDVQTLMNIAGYFHDGYIESIETVGNDTLVKFGVWSSHVTIKFTNLKESETCENVPWEYTQIDNAEMRFVDGDVEWYASDFCCCAENVDDPQCYFIAERAQYKVEFD